MLFGLIKKKKRSTNYKMKYYEYLNSKKWDRIRHKVAKRAKYTCECCGKQCSDKKTLKGFQIHHTTYENLYNENKHLDDLMFICKTCHEDKTKQIQSIKDRAKKEIASVNRKKKS